ncbi:hypothetical protein, partial [Rugamonas fusca]|uniref:hypothetical protein n=1 Tax=Rugamonas fusca TaxID=2758568 RepID=UPI001C710B62
VAKAKPTTRLYAPWDGSYAEYCGPCCTVNASIAYLASNQKAFENPGGMFRSGNLPNWHDAGPDPAF